MPIDSGLFFVDATGRLGLGDECAARSASHRLESRHICHVLGLRDEVMRNRLTKAVRGAVLERTRAVLLSGHDSEQRRIISIRPARETGWAVVTAADVAAPIDDLDVNAVAELLTLSPAEAEIAVMLAHGATLGEVAKCRSVQQETVRGQVKTILRKIGVANQKQLAALLAQLAVAMQQIVKVAGGADERARRVG